MHLAMHLSFRISLRTFLLTLAPRAYDTYYQARGLSGHTSPNGEFACFFDASTFQKGKVGTLHLAVNLLAFLMLLPFKKAKWAHFTRKEIFLEHHAFFEQPASSMSMLINCLLSWSKHRCNCSDDFPAY